MTWDAATDKPYITAAILVEIVLASETIRVHNGIGPLNWDSHTWLGVGDLGAISGISGGVDLDASDVTLLLGGIPGDLRDELMSEDVRGDRVNVYQGIVNRSNFTWDYAPTLIYAGFIDNPQIEEAPATDGGSLITITVPVLSAAAYARRIKVWRRTDADQQAMFTGDKFFAFKTDLRNPIPTPGAPQAAQVPRSQEMLKRSRYGAIVN